MFKDSVNKQAREMFEKNMEGLEDKLGFRPDLIFMKNYTRRLFPTKKFRTKRTNIGW